MWPSVAVRLLLAIAERTSEAGSTRYEPTAWLRQSPTPRNRSRWSRWTRRLASAGLIRRLTEQNRNRVRRVVITAAGTDWVNEHCGNGAILDFGLTWDHVPSKLSLK